MANLLTKLLESKQETAKRVTAFALTGVMALGTMAGCTTTTTQPSNPDIGGIHGEAETGKYSRLLTSVLNDEYYKSLMSSTKVEDYHIPAFDAHPLAFLEDQGIDVTKILDGTYQASTMSFVYDDEPNNLYINTRILIDDSYYQSYLLTYQLTDKEMADYKLVHGNKNSYSYSWPAFFMNDKISETKQPTKVLSTQYTKATHNVFQKNTDSFVNGAKDYILPSITSDNYVYLHYLKHYNNDAGVESKQITFATFKYNHVKNIDGIYEILDTYDRATIIEKTTKKATTFDLQDATIFRGQDFTYTQN